MKIKSNMECKMNVDPLTGKAPFRILEDFPLLFGETIALDVSFETSYLQREKNSN